jgi:hypothetical protein
MATVRSPFFLGACFTFVTDTIRSKMQHDIVRTVVGINYDEPKVNNVFSKLNCTQ